MSEQKVDKNSKIQRILDSFSGGDYESVLSLHEELLSDQATGFELTDREIKLLLPFKCSSLVALDRFKQVIKSCEHIPIESRECLSQRVYALYRMDDLEGARNMINVHQGHNFPGRKYLEAQIAYKMEKAEQSYKIYKHLLDSADEDMIANDEKQEVYTNSLAALTSLTYQNGGGKLAPKTLNIDGEMASFESLFNAACLVLADENRNPPEKLEIALNYLNESMTKCKKLMENSEITQEEWESERVPIILMIAYIHQIQGLWSEKALPVYSELLKSHKNLEFSFYVCLVNNYLVGKYDHDHKFSIEDWRRQLSGLNLAHLLKLPKFKKKLTAYQRSIIKCNSCILYSRLKKNRLAKSLVPDEVGKLDGFAKQKQLELMAQSFQNISQKGRKFPVEFIDRVKNLNQDSTLATIFSIVALAFGVRTDMEQIFRLAAGGFSRSGLENEKLELMNILIRIAKKHDRLSELKELFEKNISSNTPLLRKNFAMFLLQHTDEGTKGQKILREEFDMEF